MKKNRKIFLFTGMLILILFFMFLPLILSSIQRNNLTGTVEYEPHESKKNSDIIEMTVEDKLTLISSYGSEKNNVMRLNKSSMYKRRIPINTAPEKIISEIEKIMDLKIIPYVDLKEDFYIDNFSLNSYIDRNNLGLKVKVWDLTIINDEYRIFISIDKDTFTIYSLGISTYNYNNQFIDINIEKYAEYLGIQWDNEWKGKNGFIQYKVKDKDIYYNSYKDVDGMTFEILKER